MPFICITDEPYKRDFYHWVLKGHCEGYYVPVDEGFDWKVEEGEIKRISIGYPKNPFWYELGNKPDYLSSRKIYYYRAWQTYYVNDELVEIRGEWKQFTSINPTCTGFTNFDAKRMMKKYYSYHGVIMKCNIQPDPKPFICKDTKPPEAEWEIIYERWNKTEKEYTVDYDIWAFKPAKLNDICSIKFPDGKMRHYFCIIEIWDGTFFIGWSMDMNGIVMCETWSNAGKWKYFYKSYVATIWAGKPWLVWIYQWVPNSHFIIYRSKKGDMPDNYPVPIREYHEDE